MATDEETQLAKDKLRAAILEWYSVIDPDVFVDDWVLIVHKESTEMLADGQSSLGITVPTGQPFHRTTGLVIEAGKAI